MLWILCLCWNSYLLELGSHDGEEPPGGCCGVHILQMLFWGQVLCVLVRCLATYLRQRSELSPRFPSRVRKVGAVRWARGRIAKTWFCRRAVIACFLMMNLAHAEVVRIGHEIARHDLSNAFEHEHVGQRNPDRSVLSSSCARHMPTGNSRCHDDVREDPTGIKFCGDSWTNFDFANEFVDVRQEHLFAPDGYHTVCRAVHNNFVPYFGQSSDTSDGIASFGDQLMFTNVSSEVEQILFEQRSTALPRAQAIGREADGSWATAKLKAYPACGSFSPHAAATWVEVPP